MISVLKYYYDLKNIEKSNIKKQNNDYEINYNYKKLKLYEIYKKEEIIEAYNLCKNNEIFEKIILNKENSIFTKYKDKTYILVEKNNNIDFVLFKYNIINVKTILDRSNWVELWSNKIDYIEYEMKHIRGKYKIIDESINYFIGLGETAISYISYNIKNLNVYKTICRKRMVEHEMYNPKNIVIDNNIRDVGEYLKEIFWSNKKIDIDLFLSKINLNYNSSILLIARILYPSYYFDLFDLIVNNKEKEQKLNNIIFRIKEFENYIYKIYDYLSNMNDIPKINWIKKVDI